MVRYGMERSSPKRKDYAEDRPKSATAVQPRTAEPFREMRVSQPMLDAIARTTEYRKVGKSWRPNE